MWTDGLNDKIVERIAKQGITSRAELETYINTNLEGGAHIGRVFVAEIKQWLQETANPVVADDASGA